MVENSNNHREFCKEQLHTVKPDPDEYDAVLGGQAQVPDGSVILGGLEGVKMRLASAAVEQRGTALSEALKYGEAGLDLVIQAWKNESGQVKWAAYSLLRERGIFIQGFLHSH